MSEKREELLALLAAGPPEIYAYFDSERSDSSQSAADDTPFRRPSPKVAPALPLRQRQDRQTLLRTDGTITLTISLPVIGYESADANDFLQPGDILDGMPCIKPTWNCKCRHSRWPLRCKPPIGSWRRSIFVAVIELNH